MCRRTWSEKNNCLCIDMTKNEKESKYRIFKESKNTLVELTPETEAFLFFNCCSNLKTEMI